MADSGARYLVLGGCGMVGRNLTEYLLSSNLASSIRIADKSVPHFAFYNERHLTFFKDERVDFVQADLSNDAHLDNVFNPEKGAFDYVINLAAETKHGLEPQRYAKTIDLAGKCAARAAAASARCFVQLSSAHVYKSQSGKSGTTESGKIDPWTEHSRAMLEAEKAAEAAAKGIRLIILRPAVVYGPADVSGLMPRAVCAAAYFKMQDKMQFLWNAKTMLNTVHVADVCRAIEFVATHAETLSPDSAPVIYNLADQSGTNQGAISAALETIFAIRTGFHGKIVSNLARMSMDKVVADANDTHMTPWLQLLKEHEIRNTPLSPFLAKEVLLQNQLNIDGTALVSAGFTYSHPAFVTALLREQVVAAIEQGIFPPIVEGVSGPSKAAP